MKMQVNSSEIIPAALNNHQAFGSSKPRGEGICLGAKACLGRLGAGGCKIETINGLQRLRAVVKEAIQ